MLFGDGCASVVLEATDRVEGLLGEKLGCDIDARDTLVIEGMGGRYANPAASTATPRGFSRGRRSSSARCSVCPGACCGRLAAQRRATGRRDLVVPHQANLRIIEAVAKRAGVGMERVYVNVQRYGNMSAATVPVALVEALEEGRVPPGALLLMPAFGAGLTWCAHLVRWGDRVTPRGTSDVELPPCDKTALQLVQAQMQGKRRN